MDTEELGFLYLWKRQNEQDFFTNLAKVLGTSFKVSEVRAWSNGGNGKGDVGEYISLPLSIALRPELREALIKIAGASSGMALPPEYKRAKGEMVVDLGKVSKEDFINLIEKGIEPSLEEENPDTQGED